MDQNMADLLKDAFSEIDVDFEHVHDEGTNTLQIPLDTGEDVEDMIGASKLWTSEKGSDETFTNVYEQEESEASSDNSESESSNSFNTESTFSHLQEIDNNQVVNTMMAGAQQLNDTAGECTAEEGNMHSDLEAGVSGKRDLTEEEHINTLTSEYEPQVPPLKSSKSQTFDKTSSESDEEVQENYSTAEYSSRCHSLGNNDEHLLAMSPRDDMKEFTEEDQEQIEENLADYPSDLSNSETEEPSENARVQLFTLTDISSSVEHTTERMEELSNAENLQNKESPDLDYNSGIEIMEDNLNSASADIDLSFQMGTFAEDDVHEYLTDDRYTEEDAKNKEDSGDLSDVNNPADDISDSSSDDHSSSQEETHLISTVKQKKKKNHVIQHNYLTEDMLKVDDDDDIGYICKNSDDLDAKNPETKDEESNTESHHTIELVQSDTAIKTHAISLDGSENLEDTKNTVTEVLWSSSLLMDEDNLRLEEYDWDLTGDESFMVILDEGENQEYTEETLEELDVVDDDDEEENKRDWELEKTRIEAFYQFYGDQAEPEVKLERNHKVTFRLDQESSSSECYEDSDSTEEEQDLDPNTPDLSTFKPEEFVYHSGSDEDPLEKPYYPEASKMQPKEQQPANASVKQPSYRNKCLTVLKSALAFGLLTAIGIVSFWWATENLDWIH